MNPTLTVWNSKVMPWQVAGMTLAFGGMGIALFI